MQCRAHFCDLCLGEGETRLAVAKYQNDEGRWWDTCAKHLAQVKELDLHYEEFQEPGNIDPSNYLSSNADYIYTRTWTTNYNLIDPEHAI